MDVSEPMHLCPDVPIQSPILLQNASFPMEICGHPAESMCPQKKRPHLNKSRECVGGNFTLLYSEATQISLPVIPWTEPMAFYASR